MNQAKFSTLFPLGSHLCREPMPPMSELKRDMETLQRHGFNLLKLQEHWAIDEPAEGVYDFSRYEELIEHAAGLDLGIYLGLTCEQAPAWLWRKHPGCRMVGRDGRAIMYEAQSALPSDGKPGPCFDHPGARADMERFLGELVRVLGRFENVVVWNTWQEIGYWAQGLVGQAVCFCEHTLERWRTWLEGEHGDLDTLNRRWNTRYAEWQDVSPNRGLAPGMYAVDLAWQYFMDNVQVVEVLRARAAAIRVADPLGRPVFAHKGGPVIGSGQDWTYARCQDFLGSSTYPAWGAFGEWDDRPSDEQGRVEREAALRNEMWEGLALRFDYIRSCHAPGKPVWAAEFQGGPVSVGLHKGRVPTPEDIRRWVLSTVGAGVTALSFWVTRAEIMAHEMNGFSLLDSVGDTTPRLEEAARVGRALNRYPDLFGAPTRPRAPVAVLVNEWNYQLGQVLPGGGGRHLAHSTRGWHRLLWELGIPVDFVELGLAAPAELETYPVLILPFPLSLSEEWAAKLAGFVSAGGHLVSEACPGRLDQYAFCRRGELSPALADLFGVAQESLTMVREPEGGERWSPRERTWGEYREAALLEGAGPLQGQRLRANLYVETYAPQEAEACLHCEGSVAGVVRRIGEGSAWLLGTLVGHSGTSYRDADTPAAVGALLQECGVMTAPTGDLLLQKRVGERREAWFFTNPRGVEVTETVDVREGERVEDLLGEPLVQEGESVRLTVGALDVRVLIVEK